MNKRILVLIVAAVIIGLGSWAGVVSRGAAPVLGQSAEEPQFQADVDEGEWEIDLELGLDASTEEVAFGDSITIEATVANVDENNATGVELELVLDSRSLALAALPSGCELEDGDFLFCELGNLGPDEETALQLSLLVQDGALEYTFVEAFVYAEQEDFDEGNNEAANDFEVIGGQPLPDLKLEIEDVSDPASVGDTLTYRLTAQNIGKTDVSSVEVDVESDAIGTGLSLVSSTGGCVSESEDDEHYALVFCELGSLPAGASIEATLDFAVDSDAFAVVEMEAFVYSEFIDDNEDNNEAYELTDIVGGRPFPDISVSISDSADPVSIGDRLTYEISVSNLSATSDEEVEAEVWFDDVGLRFVSASEGCELDEDEVVFCEVGELEGNSSKTLVVDFVVLPDALQTTGIEAFAFGWHEDADYDNNEGFETTDVSDGQPFPDLKLEIEDVSDPVPHGGVVTYEVTVKNVGAVPALDSGIELMSYAFEDGLNLESATADCEIEEAYDDEDAVAFCELGDLEAGSEVVVSLDFAIEDEDDDVIEVEAFAFSEHPDANETNNEDFETTDVLITK